MSQGQPKRVLILMSQTGGGHRSVARAIERGLLSIGGDEIEPSIVDLFDYGRRSSLDSIVHLYAPIVVKSPALWGLVYHSTNGRRRFRTIDSLAEPFARSRVEKLVQYHSPDVIVSVHPLSNHVLTRSIRRLGLSVPVVTVLTDLIDVHAGWVSVDSDLCIAPTPVAAETLQKRGVDPRKILILGLPIGPRFGAVEEEVEEVRVSLGLQPDVFTVLVVGGSEGAGGIHHVVKAVAKSDLKLQLLVVCGRNERLRRRLEESDLVSSGRVFSFVDNMPELMHAADVVATKAGSLSIAEALASRRPVVIFKALPGQEHGNVGFVRDNGVGYAAGSPTEIREVLRRLAEDADLRQRLSANSARVRRPDAALEVARAIARLIGVVEREPVAVTQV